MSTPETTAHTTTEDLDIKQNNLRHAIKRLDDRQKTAQERLNAINNAAAESLYRFSIGEIDEQELDELAREVTHVRAILAEPFDAARKRIQLQINDTGHRQDFIHRQEKEKEREMEFRKLFNTVLDQKGFQADDRNRLLDLAGIKNKKLANHLIIQIAAFEKMGTRKEHFAETVQTPPLPLDGTI